jgi:hypothetical protein
MVAVKEGRGDLEMLAKDGDHELRMLAPIFMTSFDSIIS